MYVKKLGPARISSECKQDFWISFLSHLFCKVTMPLKKTPKTKRCWKRKKRLMKHTWTKEGRTSIRKLTNLEIIDKKKPFGMFWEKEGYELPKLTIKTRVNFSWEGQHPAVPRDPNQFSTPSSLTSSRLLFLLLRVRLFLFHSRSPFPFFLSFFCTNSILGDSGKWPLWEPFFINSCKQDFFGQKRHPSLACFLVVWRTQAIGLNICVY